MRSRIIITLLLCFLLTMSYTQVIKVKEGISVLGLSSTDAKSLIKSKGFFVETSGVSDIINFKKTTSFGDQALTVAIKDNKVSSISWEEHIMYVSVIMVDIQVAGFVIGDAKTKKFLPFKNIEKNLLLNLITKEETNQVMVVIGRNNGNQQTKPVSKNSLLQNTDFRVLNSIDSIDDFFRKYGEGKNIKKHSIVEGENYQQYLLYPDTKNEVVVDVENNKIMKLDFFKKQSDWKLPLNIKPGMSIESIVNLNQKDFSIYGFEWDEGGTVVNWNKGRFAQLNIVVQFSAAENFDQKRYLKVMGEKVFSTRQKELKGLGLTVKRISVLK